MADIPRRKVAELATRWMLEKIPHVIVEGPRDARFIKLIQREEYGDNSFKSLDVIPVDAIELPASMLEAHGLTTSGSRQRVIACIREAEAQKAEGGFRGIIDADIDVLKGCDLSTSYLWYTDYGCMDAYCWSPQALRRLVVQTRCEDAISTAAQAKNLFKSLNNVCAVLAALRYGAFTSPDWNLKLHRSTKALSTKNGLVTLDINAFIDQCGLRKAHCAEAKAAISKYHNDFKVIDPKLTLNSHDLIWLLEYTLRSLTTGGKATITEEIIAHALIAHSVFEPTIFEERMFIALGAWAKNIPKA